MAAVTTCEYNNLPIIEDFTCRRGDDLCRPVHLMLNGDPVDLTGCTLTLYLTGQKPQPITPDAPTTGDWTLYLGPALTAGTEQGQINYAVVFVAPAQHPQFPQGATKTLREGTINLSVTLPRS